MRVVRSFLNTNEFKHDEITVNESEMGVSKIGANGWKQVLISKEISIAFEENITFLIK